MNKFQRVKTDINILKLNVSDNETEPVKFKLLNSGDSVSFKILSQKERKYHIQPACGTVLKNHSIEISLDLSSITTDIFTSDDTISVIIFDKESSILIHTIDLPLRVVVANSSKVQNLYPIRPPSGFDSPAARKRVRGAAQDDPFSNIPVNSHNPAIPSDTSACILKKIIFVITFLICVVIIMLPLRGYPINEPHPLDSWVIHLARIWPESLLPNHLIQYLAIMILGAVVALFVILY